MEDARQLYKAAEKKCISIYAADTYVYTSNPVIRAHCLRSAMTVPVIGSS